MPLFRDSRHLGGKSWRNVGVQVADSRRSREVTARRERSYIVNGSVCFPSRKERGIGRQRYLAASSLPGCENLPSADPDIVTEALLLST